MNLAEHFPACNQAMRDSGVTYWIDCGTLLGAIREGGFMAHDLDIDFSCPDWSQHEAVAEAFHVQGYWMRTNGTPEHGYEQSFFLEGDHVADVFYLYDETWQGSYAHEELLVSRFKPGVFLPPEPFTFQGAETYLPANPEGVLEARYGDWRTPVLAWDYSKDPKCLVP